ncbi:AMP-binding protein [Gordonia hydrophobica]|uniref:AMP-binding protein n=1 Tax=Gordonia hydrophobica TaxID=40516 RepID=A0ABZ2TW90_9ACTN|nr:AMP-binding protein [Gordonia hydrophobica]MBM7365854.1 crotonobetaine/carnitine-CoA ligase [Gordonia hydrophobica]
MIRDGGYAPSIGDWLSECADRGTHITVDGRSTTAAELDAVATVAAAGLSALGLRPGDRVGVVMGASVVALQAWFSIARAGLVEVPLNPDSGTDLLEYCLDRAEVRVVICDAASSDRVAGIAGRIASIERVIIADRSSGTDPDALDFAALLASSTDAPPEIAPPSVDPRSAAVVLYTSGTTGPPKGVVLSHRANVNLARHTVGLMRYTSADRLYSVFPLYHSNARYCSVMAGIEAGADVILHRAFSASQFWDICRAERITAFNYQGAMMSILFKQPPRGDDRGHPVRAAFGAPCPAEIFTAVEDRFGIELTEIYGSTETSIVCDMPPSRRRIGTAGTESVNYHVRVVDDHDEPVACGVVGEIVVRPKRPGMMFDGYDARPESSVQAWRDLWFHTGDRGVLDADGFLTFVDRVKDTIRRRGENISSWEIERVVSDDPDVAQVAAYGVPSELSEEDVAIAVVPAPGARLDPATLMARVDGRLTSFARPRYVRVMDRLPLTHSQRVEKYRLRADGITAQTWDREAVRT